MKRNPFPLLHSSPGSIWSISVNKTSTVIGNGFGWWSSWSWHFRWKQKKLHVTLWVRSRAWDWKDAAIFASGYRGLHMQWWDGRMAIAGTLTLLTSAKEQKTKPRFWFKALNGWLRSKISLGLWRREVIHPHQSAIIIDKEYRTLNSRKSWESMQ